MGAERGVGAVGTLGGSAPAGRGAGTRRPVLRSDSRVPSAPPGRCPLPWLSSSRAAPGRSGRCPAVIHLSGPLRAAGRVGGSAAPRAPHMSCGGLTACFWVTVAVTFVSFMITKSWEVLEQHLNGDIKCPRTLDKKIKTPGAGGSFKT